ESAMGAAIGSFAGAGLLLVPRTRFVPVKTTDDLLVLRSDVYELSGELEVEPAAGRADNLPFVELDKRFYKLLDDFDLRFPAGPPSLREAERLVVDGDVTFGAGVVVRGAVELHEPQPTTVAPGSVLESGPWRRRTNPAKVPGARTVTPGRRSRSCLRTTTRSCAPGCGCCSTPNATSKSWPRRATSS